MDIVTGALGSVLSKLGEFLKYEYNLQAGVRKKISSLSLELESMHAALRKVAEVPPTKLDKDVKLWARDVRELSFTVEDILDDSLVRVEAAGRKRKDPDFKRYQYAANNILEVFSQTKARREISRMIDIINKKAKEVAEIRARYTLDSIVAEPATKNTVDPRLILMYRDVAQLVGIDKSRGKLMSLLQGDHVSNRTIVRVVSIVGAGGLGKTTLAKASYDELKSSYDCSAFVSVGQKPDFSNVFKDILFNLDKTKYGNIHNTGKGVHLLISELQEFLQNKRYFIVIDDIWEPKSWRTINVALAENNCGSRIIITTRILGVAEEAGEVYRLEPLSDDASKRLFYMRLGGEDKCPNNLPEELSSAILKKCGGVPLDIITMASLLLGKSREEWIEVCNSPGFYRDKDEWHMENTMHILALSYYDLPSHLKTCLLYLSVFPEDFLIDSVSLIWMWIAEGFVEKKSGRGIFEVGEEYFHDLVNRSLISLLPEYVQDVDSVDDITKPCLVHDMVLDLIVSISHEESFVTADGALSESHARRLAPKNRELDLTQGTSENLPQVRSFVVCRYAAVKWAMHPRLNLIRMLVLERCTFGEGCHSQRQFAKDLGNLSELRMLKIGSYVDMDESIERDLLQSLGNLKKMQHLTLGISFNCLANMDAWDAAVLSRDLQCLVLPHIKFPRLPSFISSALLPCLSHLDVKVRGMDQEGFKALGRLPELRYLRLSSSKPITCTIEPDGCFQKLRSLVLPFLMVQFVANEDSSASFIICHIDKGMANGSRKKHNCRVVPAVVMPKLDELEFYVEVMKLIENNIVSCDNLGLEYLPSLQRVKVAFNCCYALEDDVEREEAALRHAIQVHPNRPALQLRCFDEEFMMRRSDDDDSVQLLNEEDEEENE